MSHRKSTASAASRGAPADYPLGLQKAIEWGLCLTLLTPLLVWKRSLMPHITAKVLAFQVLTEILCALVLAASLLHGKERPQAETNPALTPTSVALASFIGVSFVSALLGADLNRSLWGFIDRQDGLVLLAHFLLWMLILIWTVRRHPEPRKLIFSYAIVSFCISVAVSFSILQESYRARAAGDGFLVWRMLETGVRPAGVFGNPIYSGPYLLLHFFWGLSATYTVGCRWRQSVRPGRIFWAGGLALLLIGESLVVFAMLAGQTRGVIFGFAGGLALMAVCGALAGSTPRAVRFGPALALLLLAAGAGALWHYRNTEVVSRVPMLNRLTRLSPAENISTQIRLFAWRSALRGFADKPLVGWGPRNVYYVLNEYYDPRHVQSAPDFRDRTATWYDKTHNAYLDLLAEGGLLGLGAFLALAAVVVRSLWRMTDRPLALCLSGGLAGYAVTNLVAFDGFGSLLALFFTLAAISLEERPLDLRRWRRADAGRKSKSRAPRAAAGSDRLLHRLTACAAGVVVLIAIYANVQIARANHGYFMARSAFEQDPGTGITLYEEAFQRFSPYHANEKIECAYLTVSSAIAKRPSSRSFDAGSLVLKLTGEALRSHPRDAQFYLLLNDMYNGLAVYGDRRLAEDAERFGKRALELSPGRQEAMFTLGRTYIIKGEAPKAVQINRRMVQEYPDFALGHWFLGLSYLSNSQRDEARKEIRDALQRGYRFQNQEEIDTVKPLFDEKEFAQLMPK